MSSHRHLLGKLQESDTTWRLDLLVAILGMVAVYGIATWVGGYQQFQAWNARLSTHGLENLPLLLASITLALAWYFWRRWRAVERINRLWLGINCHLEDEVAKREESHAEERESRRQLQSALRLQHRRIERITLIREMSDLVLSADHLDEILHISARYLPRILPFTAGAIYTLKPKDNPWRPDHAWGGFDHGAHTSIPALDCWALRHTKPYDDADCNHRSLCRHAVDLPCQRIMCIPITCRGEIFGVIQLRAEAHTAVPGGEYDMPQADVDIRMEDRELATTIGETLGLHLFNLSLREELSRESLRDPLTGILNRRGTMDTLDTLLRHQDNPGFQLAALLIDVDHFKQINDTRGHDVGDAVLRELAELIDGRRRDKDVLARWGGEEFLLVLPDTDAGTALFVAEQIRRSVESLQVSHGAAIVEQISVSIGAAAWPDHARNWTRLIKAADNALYEAKALGRNRVVTGKADSAGKTIPFKRVH